MKKQLSLASLVLTLSIGFASSLFAQDTGMLDLVKDSTPATEYISSAFKSTRVIMGQSVEMLGAGSLDFRILHRFGLITNGAIKLFGLDQSTIRFSFDYAPIDDLLVGIGRSPVYGEYDGVLKYRLLHQSKGAREMPVSVILATGITCKTILPNDPSIPNYFSSRLAYTEQVVVGSKISDLISLQLTPTLVHTNLVKLNTDPNDVYALGVGGRIRITNRISFTFDYFHSFNGPKLTDGTKNFDPLSVGFDIETGGHVFQVHVTNASGMNERSFLNEPNTNWGKGQISLGFNISRMFQL